MFHNGTKICIKILVFIFCFIFSCTVKSESNDLELVKIETAFIYQFTKFLEWSHPSTEVFKILVIGKDRFVASLNQYAVSGKRFAGKSLVVDAYREGIDSNLFDIILIDTEEKNHIQKMIRSSRGCKCVVITTQSGYTRSGALISFVKREDSTIGFSLNPEVAAENGIAVGSQLRNLSMSDEGEK